MNTALVLSVILFVLFFASAIISLRLIVSVKNKEQDIKKEKELSARRLYELSIAKEIGERIGYSLNVEEILNVITGSLRQFLDYTSVAYILVREDKLKLNFYFEKSASHAFFLNVKDKMTASLEAISGKSFQKFRMDEVISGAIEIEEEHQNLGSFFNIPLVIGGELAAILTIAHIQEGLYKEEDMTILYKIVNQASTAVTRLQELIKTEQGKLNSMVESMAEGIVMLDKDFKIIVANPAIKEIVGIPEKEHVSVFDFVDRLGGKFDIRGRVEEVMVKMSAFVSDRIEIGNQFYAVGVYPVSRALFSSPGVSTREILGVVVVFHNVSRDVEIERVREEFTSMVVHQLRSPLDSMKKTTELLVSGKSIEDNMQKTALMIYQSTSTMLELVNEILDVSRIRTHNFEVHKVESNPKDLVLDRVEFYKILAKSKNISLDSLVSANVPEKLVFDFNSTKQILNNFISNGLKYTKDGGNVVLSCFILENDPSALVDLNTSGIKVFPKVADFKINQKFLCFVVSDNGIGIREDSIKKLFTSYAQINIEEIKVERGTGLGLYIAKSIAENMGGKVGVVSLLGKGSSFYVVLPV